VGLTSEVSLGYGVAHLYFGGWLTIRESPVLLIPFFFFHILWLPLTTVSTTCRETKEKTKKISLVKKIGI